MLDLAVSFLAGLLAATLGTMAGGGGAVIEFFALLALGVPVPVALGTKRLAGLGLYPASIGNFHKAKKISYPALKAVVPLAVVGGLLGSAAVVVIEGEVLKWIVVLALAGIFALMLIRKDIGMREGKKSAWWSPAYFAASFYGGLFGSAGPASVAVLCALRGMRMLEAAATFFAGNLFLVIASLLVFLAHDLVDYRLAAAMFAGNLIGGWIGSRMALQRGDGWVRAFMLAVIVLTIGKLVLS